MSPPDFDKSMPEGYHTRSPAGRRLAAGAESTLAVSHGLAATSDNDPLATLDRGLALAQD